MLTKFTIKKWERNFPKKMLQEVGEKYHLGGGQMAKYKGHPNFDENDNPTGFDCCGGIIWAIEEVTGIELRPRPVKSFLKTEWLYEIKEEELQNGDLILVDIPGMTDGQLLRDKNGDIVYGEYNHVMTYVKQGRYDIVTTEGVGGDHRLNPKSCTTTRQWNFSEFKKVSDRIFKGVTRYKFMRIDWNWLFNWKKKHQA